MELIDKSAVVAEIERLISNGQTKLKESEECKDYESYVAFAEHIATCIKILSFLDTLEVKKMNTWHLQEKEDIYDAVKGWGLYTFACIMKDGTIQKFSGCLDEDCEGHINAHINGVNDNYDNVDDIVKWIEII